MLMICVIISARLNVYDYAMEVVIMGFFDILIKGVNAVSSAAAKQQAKIYDELERYEKRLRYKSDSELKAIWSDESRPHLERVAAQNVYKERH